MKILPIIARDYSVQNKQNINFTALMVKPVLPLNSPVEISKKSSDIKIEAIYQKLKNQLPEIKPETIEKIIAKFKDYPRKDVLQVMNRLTTFSTMTSFVNLSKEFAKEKISRFVRFESDYKTDFDFKNNLFSSDYNSLKLKQPLNVNFLFEYFFKSYLGKAPLCISENKGLVIDSDVLNVLKNKDLSDSLFDKCKFIYIKDFENTYNLFNQHNSFEEMTKDKLENLNTLKKLYPNESTENLLEKIFNPILGSINKLGITPIVIDLTKKENITSDSISKNLSQKFPEYTEFKSTLNECIKGLASNSNDKKEILDIVEQRLEAYSLKTFAKKIEKLKIMIEDNVKNQGKDVDKIYYLLPSLNKSFSLMLYMYQKINNIDNSKIFYSDLCSIHHSLYYSALDKELPNGSTLVILDDAAISGQSLFASQIYYNPSFPKENYDITFATVYSSSAANEYFNNIQQRSCKKNNDEFLFVDYQDLSFNNEIHKYKTFFKQTLLMLPHIAPDNNLSYFEKFFQLFYPRKEFVQESWDCEYL